MASYSGAEARDDACLLMATCLMPHVEDNDNDDSPQLKGHYDDLKRLQLASAVCGEALDYSSVLFDEQHDDDEKKKDDEIGGVGKEGEGGTQAFWRNSSLSPPVVVIKGSAIDFGALPDYYQAKRDLERDRIIINGTFYSGAEVGVKSLQENVMTLITDVLRKELNASTLGTSLERKIGEISEMVLIKASRTLSGGASYSSLATKVSEFEQPIPLSSLASPIGLRIGLDATPHQVIASTCAQVGLGEGEGGSRTSGALSLSIVIEASTVFLIKSFEENANTETEELILVHYKDLILLPLSLLRELQASEEDKGSIDGKGETSLDRLLESREYASVAMVRHPTITSSSPPYFASSS